MLGPLREGLSQGNGLYGSVDLSRVGSPPAAGLQMGPSSERKGPGCTPVGGSRCIVIPTGGRGDMVTK